MATTTTTPESTWYTETMEALDRASAALQRAREQIRRRGLDDAAARFRKAAEIAKQGREARYER